MTTTKRRLVNSAFIELGYTNAEFDIAPEQLTAGLLALDLMMGEWIGNGARIGYAMPTDVSDSRFDVPMDIPSWAYSAVVSNLAVYIAPSIGKVPSPQTLIKANTGWSLVVNKSSRRRKIAIGPMLAGAGYKRTKAPFLPEQENDIVERPEEALGLE